MRFEAELSNQSENQLSGHNGFYSMHDEWQIMTKAVQVPAPSRPQDTVIIGFPQGCLKD